MASEEKPSRSSRLFERVIQTSDDPASGHHALTTRFQALESWGGPSGLKLFERSIGSKSLSLQLRFDMGESR